jgi:acetoacetyl-CoA synthetase
LPNYIDALLIFLACAACGAVFSSTAPDMGASGIIDRYRQFKPVVFICQTEVTYAGKYIDLQAKMTQVHAQLKEQVAKLSHCVVVRGPLLPGPDV